MKSMHIKQKPLNGIITITLPEEMKKYEEFEILLRPSSSKSKKPKFDPNKFNGFMKNIPMNIEDEITKMREEWERTI